MKKLRNILRVATVLLVAAGALVAAPELPAAPNRYVTVSDGVSIALNISYPNNYVEGGKYPTIFEMSGYDGGSATGRTLMGEVVDRTGQAKEAPLQDDSRQLTEAFRDNYFIVHASVRGTGCSSGEFDLFSYRSALDGHELIEWIALQPWSDGKVGIMGHSYSGITGFMVAATRPPHLEAITVSGLIDDVYRGLTFPGGVANFGFPLLWTQGVRTFYDVGGGALPGLVRPIDEPGEQNPQCAQNQASRGRTVVDDPLLNAPLGLDSDWFRARSLVSYANRINVPAHLTGSFQDEQTGPRGAPHLFEMLGPVPRRLILTNGNHDADWKPKGIMDDRLAWMDQWMRGVDGGFGPRKERVERRQNCKRASDGLLNCTTKERRHRLQSSVTHLFELQNTSNGYIFGSRLDRANYPLEDTEWTSWYLREDGGLSPSAPGSEEGSDSYITSQRQSWSYQAGPRSGSEFTSPEGPDEVNYSTEPLASPVVIAGPVTANLFLSTSAPVTEMMVQLIDVAPDGSNTYLQRGLLRATHARVDESRSDFTESGHMYRPFRPHDAEEPVTPGAVNEYAVEVWPTGHIFREGHRIAVKILAPPLVDSYYAYIARRVPSVDTVHHSASHPSRVTLPVIAAHEMTFGPEVPCGSQEAVRCIP